MRKKFNHPEFQVIIKFEFAKLFAECRAHHLLSVPRIAHNVFVSATGRIHVFAQVIACETAELGWTRIFVT